MIVLGIETSTACSSVALIVDGQVVVHEQHEDARGHGAFLAPAIRRCLDVLPAGVASVEAVAVGTGPGLYTGLRIGMATAIAFASARAIPVVGVGGMDAITEGVRESLGDPMVDVLFTTLDARRGQVFWAAHREQEGHLLRIDGPRVGTREELDADIAARSVHASIRVIGEVACDVLARPDAVATARIALRQLAAASDGVLPETPRPVYLREADVRIGWPTRGGVRAGASVIVDRMMEAPRADSSDAAAMLALEVASQERPLGLEALLRETEAGGLVLVAREDSPMLRRETAESGSDLTGRPVGFASARLLADEAHVIRLVVAETHRQRGVGRRLLTELVRWAVETGALAVLLGVRTTNTAALSLYEAEGFVVEGSRPQYYPDGEDALLLRLPIAASVRGMSGQVRR